MPTTLPKARHYSPHGQSPLEPHNRQIVCGCRYFFVPGLVDPHGLTTLLGGRVQFKQRLEALFDPNYKRVQDGARDVTGCIGQSNFGRRLFIWLSSPAQLDSQYRFCHGNEVVHHVPYLYNAIGMPWLTQLRVDDILVKSKLYNAGPNGLPGNDDCGQISAWLVLSALGFYSADPCSAVWELGRPLVEAANVTLRASPSSSVPPPVLRIVVHDQARTNPYVRAVLLDGAMLRRTFIFHSELMRGPLLEFIMSKTPERHTRRMPHRRRMGSIRAPNAGGDLDGTSRIRASPRHPLADTVSARPSELDVDDKQLIG